MKPKIYFDNCALGKLYLEKKGVKFTELINNFKIYLSAINIAELLSYKNINQRNELLKFFCKLNVNDYYPLDFPTQILKETYQAFKSKRESRLNISEFGRRLLYLLKFPDEITEEDVKVCENYTKSSKNLFELRKINAKKDPRIKDLIKSDENHDAISYLKIALKNKELMNLIFDKMMKLLKISNYIYEDGYIFIPNFEPWLLCFGSDILTYYRIIFEPTAIPDQLDIFQVIYLSATDYFITEDNNLFDLLNIFLKSDVRINEKKVYKLNEFLDEYNLRIN